MTFDYLLELRESPNRLLVWHSRSMSDDQPDFVRRAICQEVENSELNNLTFVAAAYSVSGKSHLGSLSPSDRRSLLRKIRPVRLHCSSHNSIRM